MRAPGACSPMPASTSTPESPATAVSEDLILGGRLKVRQPALGYRVGIDPVFLAAAAPAASRALDLGCGVGAAALCLAHRLSGTRVQGLELQADLARLARENAALNQLAGRIQILDGDLLRPPEELGAGAFDLVLANPPFHAPGQATAPADQGRALGHMEGEAGLADWIRQALRLTAPGGELLVIHRPQRLGEILGLLEGRTGAIVVFPLWPAANRPARRVIVSAHKGSAAPTTLAAGLALHQADGRYTAAAEAVLRGGEALPMR